LLLLYLLSEQVFKVLKVAFKKVVHHCIMPSDLLQFGSNFRIYSFLDHEEIRRHPCSY